MANERAKSIPPQSEQGIKRQKFDIGEQWQEQPPLEGNKAYLSKKIIKI